MNTEENTLEVRKSENLQMMPLSEAKDWYNQFVNFTKEILKKDLDFGIIPGTAKPSLYKPGAEKLRFVYGLGVETVVTDKHIDYEKGVVDYTYKTTVKDKNGRILSECEGSANSFEPKFGYVWKSVHELPEGTDISNLVSKTTGKKAVEFAFAIEKAETSGQYGKPAEYWRNWQDAIMNGKATKITKTAKTGRVMDAWEMDDTITMYRVQNPDVIGLKNTIMKMAQKRSFVGAMLIATGASEFFTQDVEDMDIKGNGDVYSDAHPTDEHYTDFEVVEETEMPQISGTWAAKIEKVKSYEDWIELYNKNRREIDLNPKLQAEFKKLQTEFPKP